MCVVRAYTSAPYPGMGTVFRCRPGIVRDVDSRRDVPRTDLLLADPRLAEAERRLGRALVKAAVGRVQQQAMDRQITPAPVADADVAGRRRDRDQRGRADRDRRSLPAA